MILSSTQGHPPNSQCGTCSKAVTWKQKGVCCDSCDTWYHIRCQNLRTEVYNCMNNSNISWVCIQCGLPKWSSSFLNDMGDISVGNRYQSLSLDSTIADWGQVGSHTQTPRTTQIGSPLASSSPKPGRKVGPTKCSPLKLLSLNCRSVVNKKDSFQNLVDSTQPDIIVATETWLNDDIKDGEIGQVGKFTNKYKIYRQDRTTRNGGVMIAIAHTLKSTRSPELETGGEQV